MLLRVVKLVVSLRQRTDCGGGMGWVGLGAPPEKLKGSEFEARVVAVSGLSCELSELLSGEECRGGSTMVA